MGLFSLFNRSDEPTEDPEGDLQVDLASFGINQSTPGSLPAESDFFAPVFTSSDVFKPLGRGFEIGTRKDELDYLFIAIAAFDGELLQNGQTLALDETSTTGDVQALFGEPYWTDDSDDETILFYEYDKGGIELQFEFVSDGTLGFITLMKNGVLSTAEQRDCYGVSKPWPPAGSST